VVTGELGEGTGNTICTVHRWFLSALPSLLSTVHLRAILNAKQKKTSMLATFRDMLSLSRTDSHTLSVLAFSIAICIFCLQCVRIKAMNRVEMVPSKTAAYVGPLMAASIMIEFGVLKGRRGFIY